jgi:class 3 adenylate cyclase
LTVRYARNGNVHLAYSVLGHGPPDILLVSTWFVPIESMLEGPPMTRALERIAGMGRLILFDSRGIGMSDPTSSAGPLTVEQWMTDGLAVMDEVGAERPALLGLDPSGALVTLLLAATNPHRVSALVLFNAHARFTQAPDYPIGVPSSVVEARSEGILNDWISGGAGLDTLAPEITPNDPIRDWWIRARRRGASPATVRGLLALGMGSDLRAVLPSIRAQTLVLHRSGSRSVPVAHGRYLGERIPGARFVELDGESSLFFLGDSELLMDEVEEFLTGSRVPAEPDRILATLLFTDIVGSTRRVAEIGDRAWRELLDRHHDLVRRQLSRFRGREVKTTGDGFLASFDGPARAIRCAIAIRDVLRQVGIDARFGVHTGEVEIVGNDLAGIAVHIGQRVSSHASAGEVLVSKTVADLVAGSGVTFADRGQHELRGVPGWWPLLAVTGT